MAKINKYDNYLNGILTSIEYTSISIFDDKYYYIVEPHKVSRIDRKSVTIELVYEVVQKYRFLVPKIDNNTKYCCESSPNKIWSK